MTFLFCILSMHVTRNLCAIYKLRMLKFKVVVCIFIKTLLSKQIVGNTVTLGGNKVDFVVTKVTNLKRANMQMKPKPYNRRKNNDL